MENKYFTPDIEDIHIGYQYEIFQKGKPYDPNFMHFMPQQEEDTWIKMTYPDAFLGYDLKRMFKIYQIRVPYLTKEQIEAEGWKHDERYDDVKHFYINELHLTLYIGYLKEEIIYHHISIFHGGGIMFRGECKDINTFRKIIKLLEI